MDLRNQYKRLFEGKVSSNDQGLLFEGVRSDTQGVYLSTIQINPSFKIKTDAGPLTAVKFRANSFTEDGYISMYITVTGDLVDEPDLDSLKNKDLLAPAFKVLAKNADFNKWLDKTANKIGETSKDLFANILKNAEVDSDDSDLRTIAVSYDYDF
jgi:hypothetical protein